MSYCAHIATACPRPRWNPAHQPSRHTRPSASGKRKPGCPTQAHAEDGSSIAEEEAASSRLLEHRPLGANVREATAHHRLSSGGVGVDRPADRLEAHLLLDRERQLVHHLSRTRGDDGRSQHRVGPFGTHHRDEAAVGGLALQDAPVVVLEGRLVLVHRHGGALGLLDGEADHRDLRLGVHHVRHHERRQPPRAAEERVLHRHLRHLARHVRQPRHAGDAVAHREDVGVVRLQQVVDDDAVRAAPHPRRLEPQPLHIRR
eukprot:CAMPEP_0184385142 /NCGR_PEP_ID=MMETSP0007-20130409/8561_1 /TAXON_ID=97485 /ORGANISM="Prymnesium parvum, Strain Texoma1" /LENGTH=258 /DNA_ID=CAMNT_0026732345 /DNA_START=448 /DNA_END=1220 /DNA_ORIENTATION=+